MLDKIQHFFVTTCITVFIGYPINIYLGVFLATLFSSFKEVYDNRVKMKDFDERDIIADVLGILFGIFLIIIISLF